MNKFEDKIGEIDQILKQKRSFWTLEAVTHMGYDDVCQIIRIHIFKKFSSWDQNKPFAPWAARLISNQITNLRIKCYGKFAPPCKGCEHNLGENRCSLNSSGEKSEECEEYAKWQKKKESAYRLLLAESVDKSYDEDPGGEGRIKIEAPLARDYQKAQEKLHMLVLESLNDRMGQLYSWLFIENRSNEFIAERMGFKAADQVRRTRFKQIENLKKILIARAKKIMIEHDIFSNE